MERLQAIANLLAMTRWNSIGVRGKMTVCVYYYLYSRLSGVNYYERMADNLVDEILRSITKMDVSFENGLCGVAYMLKYLARERYIEMDDDSLLDIDDCLAKITSLAPDINNDYAVIPMVLYIASYPMTRNRYKFFKIALDMSEYYLNNLSSAKSPLKVTNSIIYFVNFLHRNKIYGKRVNAIYRRISEVILPFLDNLNKKRSDIVTMTKLISLSDGQMEQLANAIREIDYDGVVVDNELELRDLWQRFFYFSGYKNKTGDLENYLDEQLTDISYEDSNINYAFLGISLIENRLKATMPSPFTTDILYVSTSVGAIGGAFNAGHRIHLGLREIGINSKMLVLNSNLDPKQNLLDEIYIASKRDDEKYGYNKDMQPLLAYPKYSMSSHSFSPAVVGVDIIKNINAFNPKIVLLHGINGGFISIEDIGKIRGKIIWRLPDCWAFTGGCYYFGSCRKYITGCGKCPKLYSDNELDLSYDVWKRKEKSWNDLDMTIVVPSFWMKEAVQSSTLLMDRKIYVIPNGLNIEMYYPFEKQIARKSLGVCLDKKVILFGAIGVLDPRKGFALLLKALKLLSEKHKDEYCLVIFGSGMIDIDVGISTRFLGYIHNQETLRKVYSAADVMIVPSLEEAFGQTVIEAMACATPVVSFSLTGVEDVIDHKQTGYLACHGDVNDIANGIEWVLSDNDLTRELSCNSRRKVETVYDIKLIARQYEVLYNELLL